MSTLPVLQSAKTLWCALSDDPELDRIVNDPSTFPSFGHVVTTDQRSRIAALIPGYERAMKPAPPEEIERFTTKLSIAFPASKISDMEAEVRLEQYREALADIPRDVLGHAYLAIIRSCRFFPTVAEIREHCTHGATRSWQLSRLRALAKFHDRNPPLPDGIKEEMVDWPPKGPVEAEPTTERTKP